MALSVVECIDFVSDVGEGVLAALAHGFPGCPQMGLDGLGFNNGNYHRVLRCGHPQKKLPS
ncbi:hypothetical protein [Corynebacterium diphtheriae]|uniref:hypothetical protein n=1 Tax=Corynebacterium diphtheriae TaxID=1717 RepID=UPI0015A6DC71|nr:hypothetical protein [Corynebacterium diphtheriae]